MAAGRTTALFRMFQSSFRRHVSFRRYAKLHEDNAYFGYESVSKEEKSQKGKLAVISWEQDEWVDDQDLTSFLPPFASVHDVFHNVAESYDLMNDIMSMGIHRPWKQYFIEKINPSFGNKLLDMAGGTGDIALRYLNSMKYKRKTGGLMPKMANDTTEIIVCDVNQAMLNVGKRKAETLGISQGISWVCGNGEELPFSDDSFDVYTVAFGIRNFTNVDKALDEAYRVLRPGGRFMCLEFSEVSNPVLTRLYDLYSFQVIPVMGQIIARDWESYQYLVESIRQFPNQEEFASMIQSSGFRTVNYENLTFGIAAIHSACKI